MSTKKERGINSISIFGKDGLAKEIEFLAKKESFEKVHAYPFEEKRAKACKIDEFIAAKIYLGQDCYKTYMSYHNNTRIQLLAIIK